MKIFQFVNQFTCVSSATEFSKEQNKLSTSTVYHKHYCYETFLIYHKHYCYETFLFITNTIVMKLSYLSQTLLL